MHYIKVRLWLLLATIILVLSSALANAGEQATAWHIKRDHIKPSAMGETLTVDFLCLAGYVYLRTAHNAPLVPAIGGGNGYMWSCREFIRSFQVPTEAR